MYTGIWRQMNLYTYILVSADSMKQRLRSYVERNDFRSKIGVLNLTTNKYAVKLLSDLSASRTDAPWVQTYTPQLSEQFTHIGLNTVMVIKWH